MNELTAGNKDEGGLRVSHLSIYSDSVAPNTVKSNLRLMFADRRLIKYLFHFIGLCVLSFLPLIFAGVALAFSSPPTSAKIAIYLVTLAISLISIGFSGWLVYRRLRKAINAQGPSEEQHRDSMVSDHGEDAYQYNLGGPDDISAPPMASQQQPMYFDNQQHISMPLPPIPPAPPLTLDNVQVPATNHEYPSGNTKDYIENSNNYDDGAQLYAFETVKIHPEQSRSPLMPTAPGNNQNAASSIDDLVESMLKNFGNQPSTSQAPSIPLPAIQPNSRHNAEDIDSQRKADAKRKLLQEAMDESSDGEDFFDSDSDNMSSKGVSPGHSEEGGWRPTSMNYDNIAAHIAQALNKPNDSDSHGALHVTNGVQSVDVSPRSVEYVTTPPAQSAVVYTRSSPTHTAPPSMPVPPAPSVPAPAPPSMPTPPAPQIPEPPLSTPSHSGPPPAPPLP
ncbi:hypothetical protein BX667DRAFT_518334 [Coemansia mojavensis]|nr:hypothetical protein BX667DRAFT_518334 [Coemansia mojavensis]